MSPASCARNCFVLIGLLLGFSICAHAQTNPIPREGEYTLSGALNGDQVAPRVALGAAGGFIVFQDNGIDGSGLGIGARRLDANQAPAGAVFRVNEITAGDQERPAVVLLNAGGAVVAWQGGLQGFQNVFMRFLNADGSFATRDITVNSAAGMSNHRMTTNWMIFRNNRVSYRTQRVRQIITSKQERGGGVAVATLSDGTVVIAYTSARRVHEKVQAQVPKVRFIYNRFITNSVLQWVETDTDSMQDVYFQLFSPAGQKIGSEIRANQFLDLNQSRPAVAALSDGTFVLAWNSDEQSALNTVDVVARRFDALGNALGDEFLVNTASRGCGNPSVAGHAESGFTITWAQKSPERTNSLDIYARVFDASAAPVAAPFIVNAHTYGDQYSPAIAATTGEQVIVWTSLAQDGSREGVYGRALNNGVLAGDEFRVNTTTYLRQFHPHIAADQAGRFLAVWSSYQTMAGFDVFGQRYTRP